MSTPVPTTMHALRLHRPRSAQQEPRVRWEDVPTPRPGAGEVLVRVEACGVDADDLALVAGERPATRLPVTLGREAVGVVAVCGPEVPDWQPGDRVALAGAVPCGRCGLCTVGRDNLCRAREAIGRDRDGALAELVHLDARQLLPAPGEVPAELVALVTRTVAVPYHALKRGGAGEGVTLSVHGLTGRGLHAVQLAKLTGAYVIGVDRDGSRLERARGWGADEVVAAGDDAAGRIVQLTEGGVDGSLTLAHGAEHARTAVDCLRPGGRATLTSGAWPLPERTLARIVDEELEIVGAQDPTLQDVGELLDLLEDGRLDLSRSVELQVPAREVPTVLLDLETGRIDPVSVVATPA